MNKKEAIKVFEEKHQCKWNEIEDGYINIIYINSTFYAIIKYNLKPEDFDFIEYGGDLLTLKEILNIIEQYYL